MDELPIGFAMALAKNPDAMQKFAALSEAQKRVIIEGTCSVNSRDEMHRYVDGLVSGKQTDDRA